MHIVEAFHEAKTSKAAQTNPDRRFGLTPTAWRPHKVLDCEHAILRCSLIGMRALYQTLTSLLRHSCLLTLRSLLLTGIGLFCATRAESQCPQAAILVYHRFGPTVADSMTTRTQVFEQQLDALRDAGYEFVSLDQVLAGLRGAAPLPPKAVTITVDDGHRTVYSDLLPVIRRKHLPVTLFIYPSAISHASYALTWGELRELAATPGVRVQSHTFWHPNFHTEKHRLTADAYRQFVRDQLERPRTILKQQLGLEVDALAWPFGIVDDELQGFARASGYQAAFALGNRNATSHDPLWALPRYLIVDAVGVQGLLRELKAGARCTTGATP